MLTRRTPVHSYPAAIRAAMPLAAAYAAALFAGYAIGIALAFIRLKSIASLRSAAESGTFGVDQLDPMLVSFGDIALWLDVYRFPNRVVLHVEAWLVTVVLILSTAVVSVAAATSVPLRFASGRPSHAPPEVIPHLRAFWQQTLSIASTLLGRPPWLFLAAAAGFCGAIIAEAYNVVKCEAGLIRGIPTAPRERIVGLIAPEDGLWLVLWTAFVPFLVVLLSARSRLSRDPEFLNRWCLDCGYPRATTDAGPCCPECGAPRRNPSDRTISSSRWPALAATALLATAIGLHAYVPHLPRVVQRMMNASVIDSNVVTIPGTSTILVERPTDSIWFRVDQTAPGAPEATLHMAVVFPTQLSPILVRTFTIATGARPSDPQVISLPDGRQFTVAFDWQGDFARAYVYITPGGATSIRPANPADFPR